MAQRRPTMMDVGKHAHVSAQTVSRYFTGRGYVSDETRNKIDAAINELGYQFNQVASNLRVQHTHTVGLLTIGPTNFGNASITTGMTSAARRAGYSVLSAHVEVTANGPAVMAEGRRAIEQFLELRVDGITLVTPFTDSTSLTSGLKESVPVVVVAHHPGSTDRDGGASYDAARMAVGHLADQGHRQIIHLGGPPDRNETVERLRGYRDELAARDLKALPVKHAAEWTAASGFDLGEAARGAFTGVFAANDQLALGFIASMRAHGMFAPMDYSIVGIDDIPEAAFLDPPLTTVRLDFIEVGRHAFEFLRSRIESGPEPVEVSRPVLIRRSSTRSVDSVGVSAGISGLHLPSRRAPA